MQSTLKVAKFGPIEHVELNLKNVNVFIGPQASGKSALAKLYTIFKAPRKFINDTKKNSIEGKSSSAFFREILEEYNIVSFLQADSEISFNSALHNMDYKNGVLNYEPKLLKKIEQLEELKTNFGFNLESIKKMIYELTQSFVLFNFKVYDALKEDSEPFGFTRFENFKNLDEEKFSTILENLKETEHNLSMNAALYIPAERNFINIIKNSSLNLLRNNVPIPKHILNFGAEVEKSTVTDIDLSFLQRNLRYKNLAGEDRIYTSSNHSIRLSEAASGVQSAMPILLPILSQSDVLGHRSFVIEEPELNLFPTAQYELIKRLESSRKEAYWEDYGTIHTYTTHSPYILSAVNNLLYADKVRVKIELIKQEDEKKGKLKLLQQIIPSPINPYYFTAYQVCNGKAESIFETETGLIKDNFIDKASDKIVDDFDDLMNLLNSLN